MFRMPPVAALAAACAAWLFPPVPREAAAAIAVSLPAVQEAKPAPDAPPKPYVIGSQVDPALALRELDGTSRSLREYLGKQPLILVFWSIQCPITRGYEPRLQRLAADAAKLGATFLAVDANATELGKDGDTARIQEYVKKQKIAYPVLIDVGNVVADRFDARTTPHAFLLDATGKLRYAGAIDDDPELKRTDGTETRHLLRALEAVLAGKEPPVATTKATGCTIKRVTKKSG